MRFLRRFCEIRSFLSAKIFTTDFMVVSGEKVKNETQTGFCPSPFELKNISTCCRVSNARCRKRYLLHFFNRKISHSLGSL